MTNISLSLNTASDVGPVHQLSGKVRKPQSPGFNTGSCPEVWGKTCLGLISFVEKADFHLLSQDTIIIYTEFAATMVLGASEKKISSLSSNLNNILKYYFKFRSYPARAIHKMRPLWY